MPKPILISRSTTHPYVLQSNRDDPSSEQVTFNLRALSVATRKRVMNEIVDVPIGLPDQDAQKAHRRSMANPGDCFFEACRDGIESWTNWPEAKFERRGQGLSDETLEQLPDEVIAELAGEIIKISQGGGEDDEETTGN